MSAEDQELVHRERSKGSPIVVMGLPLLPVLYVLSPPFTYLLVRKPLDSSPVCQAIYAPLIYLNRESPLVHSFYQWYDSLFPWGREASGVLSRV